MNIKATQCPQGLFKFFSGLFNAKSGLTGSATATLASAWAAALLLLFFMALFPAPGFADPVHDITIAHENLPPAAIPGPITPGTILRIHFDSAPGATRTVLLLKVYNNGSVRQEVPLPLTYSEN